MREMKLLLWLVVGVLVMVNFATAQSCQCCTECPDDYVRLGDYCYRFVKAKKTWAEARADCFANGGGDLVSLESARELALISQYLDLKDEGFSAFWTSGRRMEGIDELSKQRESPIEPNRQFYWGTGFDFSFCQWLPGEPNNFENSEDCIELRYWRGRIAGINDGQCSSQNAYICENLHV